MDDLDAAMCNCGELSDFWESIVGMRTSYEKLIGQMLGALEVVCGGSRLQNTFFLRWETRFFLCGPRTIEVVPNSGTRAQKSCRRSSVSITS